MWAELLAEHATIAVLLAFEVEPGAFLCGHNNSMRESLLSGEIDTSERNRG